MNNIFFKVYFEQVSFLYVYDKDKQVYFTDPAFIVSIDTYNFIGFFR